MAGRHDPVSLGSPQFLTVEHGPFLVTEAFFPSRLRLPPHTHERTVLAITLHGRWTSTLSKTHESVRGHLLTEPAGDRHSNQFAANGARVLIVQPDPSAGDLLHPCAPLLKAVNHRPSVRANISALGLTREIRTCDDLSSLAVQSLCLELLSAATREGTHIPVSGDRWLTRIEDYLRAHFRECPSLDTLATVAGVHPAHLTRAFRSRYGMSPGQFVRALRVEWAASALRDTRQPIAAIAQSAGFADQSHFTRLFRRALGVTPAQFRKDSLRS
jgi:AraC family transcriptional regulator